VRGRPRDVPTAPRAAAAGVASVFWIGACWATVALLQLDVRQIGVLFFVAPVYLAVATGLGVWVGHRVEPGVVFPPGLLIGMVLGLIAAALVGGLLYERLDRFLWAEYEVHWKPPAWFFAGWCGIGCFLFGKVFASRRHWRGTRG
jgi:hypothetical protein